MRTPWRARGSRLTLPSRRPPRSAGSARPPQPRPIRPRPRWPGPRRPAPRSPRRPPSLSMTVPQTTASMTSSTAGLATVLIAGAPRCRRRLPACARAGSPANGELHGAASAAVPSAPSLFCSSSSVSSAVPATSRTRSWSMGRPRHPMTTRVRVPLKSSLPSRTSRRDATSAVPSTTLESSNPSVPSCVNTRRTPLPAPSIRAPTASSVK